MPENSTPNFHPASVEARIQMLMVANQEKVQFNKDLVRTLEAENDVLEEVNETLANIIAPPEPEDPRLTASSLPVYSKGYSSMQAQAEAHAQAQGRPIKDNPQA